MHKTRCLAERSSTFSYNKKSPYAFIIWKIAESTLQKKLTTLMVPNDVKQSKCVCVLY